MKKRIPILLIIAASVNWVMPSAISAEDFVNMEDLIGIDDLPEDEDGANSPSIADPLEGLNRAIFGFNDFVYKKVFRPFSRTYVKIVPRPVRKGLDNFFENLEFPVRFTGSVLQFKFVRAGQETGKFIMNTTAGIGGFLDAAEDIPALNPPKEDIGQAFGSWGINHGFYIVLPFVGPSSLRDLVGRYGGSAVDPISEPWSQIDDDGERFALRALDTVNDLPEIIDFYFSISDSAIDPYTAMRDGYTQFRANQVKN